ncbi:MAG: hypothetical protein AAGF83_00405 [Cyanobacteria bacterium P01_G01_bin.67]
MLININELQPEVIQTIRGTVSEVEDDEFTLTDSSGSIEVDLDDDDLDDDIDDDDDDDVDDDIIDDFLSEIEGQEVTVVGELDDDDDDDDIDDLELEALRVTKLGESLVFREEILEDAVDLGAENDNFVHDTPEGVIVNGGEGNDSLTGAGGDDFLVGGAGDDLITSTAGFDTFLVGNGADTVVNFKSEDVLSLNSSFDDIEQILGADGAATQVGQDTFIDLGNGDSITLLDFAVADLNPENFALI